MRDMVLKTLLTMLLKYLAGPAKDAFLNITLSLADANMSGEDKKRSAINQLKALGTPASQFVNAMATWALNLALEAAVAKLKLEYK